MIKILLIFTLNMMLLPIITFGLLVTLQPSSISKFRFISFCLIVLVNYFILKNWKIEKDINIKIDKFALLYFGLGSLLFWFRFYYEPEGMWDAWAAWNAKAKDLSLSFLRGYDFALYRDYWLNPQYPIILPLQISFFTIFLGHWTPFVPIFLGYSYYLFLFIIVSSIANRVSNTTLLKHYILLLSLAHPLYINIASDQCADLIVSQLLLHSFLAIYFYFEFKIKEGLSLFLLSIVFLINTKLEGGVFSIILLIVFIVKQFFSELKIRIRNIHLISLVITVFGAILFIYYKYSTQQFTTYKLDPVTVFRNFLDWERHMKVFSYLGLFFLITFFAFIFLPIKIRVEKKLFLSYIFPLVGILSFYYLSMVLTPFNIDWHLNTAYIRINLQTFPTLLVMYLLLHINSLSHMTNNTQSKL